MKYNAHTIKKITDALSDGQGRVRACRFAGICHETFMNWMNTYSEFSDAIKKAEENGNDYLKDLCKRRVIKDKSWQSAAWWLERNYPMEYSLRYFNENNVIPNLEITVIRFIHEGE